MLKNGKWLANKGDYMVKKYLKEKTQQLTDHIGLI